MNERILACIDGRSNSAAVLDAAIWAAQRLRAPLSLVHALEPHPQRAALSDHGGALGLGAYEALQHELGRLDERRGQLERQAGEELLQLALRRAQAAGLDDADSRLCEGLLDDVLLGLQDQAQLLLLGQHYHPSSRRRLHLDHRVEQLLREVERPVLVLPGASFQAPQRALIGFDASLGARAALRLAAAGALLVGLPLILLWVGGDEAQARTALAEAARPLSDAGHAVITDWQPGAPEDVLPALLAGQADTLLLIGAHGHGRLRQLVLGSTTASLLRLSPVPVLVAR